MKIITGSTGTTHVTSDDDRQFNAAVFGNEDVMLPNGNKMAATLVNNNLITIADGDLCMQGCHARIKANTSEDCVIETGSVGTKRIDLICARYTLNAETGYEDVRLVVVKGSQTTGSPTAPTVNSNTSLRSGATIHDMVLYEVLINGVNISGVTAKFKQAKFITDAIAEHSAAIATNTTNIANKVNTSTYNARVTAVDNALAGKVDTSTYNARVKSVDSSLSGKASTTALTNGLAGKVDNTTYNARVTAVDNALAGKVATSTYNSRVTAVDNALAGKASTGTTDALSSRISSLETANTIVSGTLSAGATSITLSNGRITANSVIEVYYWVSSGSAIEAISYNTIAVSSGKVVLTFDALSYALNVGIRIS